MHAVFAEFLREHGACDATVNEALAVASPLELPTRHVLLNQGAAPDSVYFLIDGVCHACYLTPQGKQFSKEFYWDQDILIGFESLLTGSASPYLLETLSASHLLALPISLLNHWREQRNPLYVRLLERQLRFKEHKERFMLLHSPEQRLQLFCDSFPELLERVTDYQLASYLGVTATSLSRIRKRQDSPPP